MPAGRIFCAFRFALMVVGATASEARPAVQDWVSGVVSKVSRADRPGLVDRAGGVVTVRVRIGLDGALDGVSIDDSSGSATIDERAIRAVRAASPFPPPPAKLLTLEGYTELSFPLQLESKPMR